MTLLQADYEMLSALDEGTMRRRRPVSETMLASLPTHMHMSSNKVGIFLSARHAAPQIRHWLVKDAAESITGRLKCLVRPGLRNSLLSRHDGCKTAAPGISKGCTRCRVIRMNLRRSDLAAFAWRPSKIGKQ